MPDVNDLLANANDGSNQGDLQAGLGLDGSGKNPLERMDQISKTKPGSQKTSGDNSLDPSVIEQMLMTGENTEGMFEPDTPKEKDGEPKIHEEQDEKAKAKIPEEAKPSKKYEKDFKEDILKHPDDYKVMTPRGEMTIAEAIKKGYNPLTKEFEKDRDFDAIREKHLNQLNEDDRASIDALTQPSAAQLAPADAEQYGLAPDSPFIKQPAGVEPNTQLPQGGVTMMPEQQAQVAAPQQAAAQPDIAAMLGGGM